MGPDLETTNLMLGVMAAVSVIEALVLIGLGIGGFMLYRRVMALVNEVEEKRIRPIAAKVDAILGDVHAVTAKVQAQAARVDHAINGTMERVDDTAARVKHTVRDRIEQVVAVAHGVRAVVASLFGRRVPNY